MSGLAPLRFELGKALRMRATWITLGLPPLLAAGAAAASHFAQRAELAERGSAAISSAFVPFARGASSGLVLGAVLLLFYASGLFANEGSLRTYKTLLVRPHARGAWVLAKLALALGMALALLVAVALAAGASAAALGDYTDIAEEGYVIYAAGWMREQSLWALLLAAPPLLALAALGLWVSALTDHGGIAAAASIGSYMVLEVLKDSLSGMRPWLFNSFAPSLLDTSYLEALRGFASGMSDAGWESALFGYNLVTPLVWAALFAALTWLRFARREFAL
jgi:ABC-type transport system involved in multi-copper enzyme maturation permease subunit